MGSFDPTSFRLDPNAQRIEKPWGYEILLSPADAPYTAKLIHVQAGKRLSLQLHDTKVETQTLVAGQGILVLEGPDGQLHDDSDAAWRGLPRRRRSASPSVRRRRRGRHHLRGLDARGRQSRCASKTTTRDPTRTRERCVTRSRWLALSRCRRCPALFPAARSRRGRHHRAVLGPPTRRSQPRLHPVHRRMCLLICGALAVWLRTSFPPDSSPRSTPTRRCGSPPSVA